MSSVRSRAASLCRRVSFPVRSNKRDCTEETAWEDEQCRIHQKENGGYERRGSARQGGFRHDERPEMLVEYRAAVHPPRSIKMLPADDREFADVFLSVGGVWSYAQVESVSNLTATIQVHRTRRRIFAAHDCSDDVGNTETVFQLKAMASTRKTKQQPIASNAAVAADILKYKISNVNRLLQSRRRARRAVPA